MTWVKEYKEPQVTLRSHFAICVVSATSQLGGPQYILKINRRRMGSGILFFPRNVESSGLCQDPMELSGYIKQAYF